MTLSRKSESTGTPSGVGNRVGRLECRHFLGTDAGRGEPAMG